MRFIKWVLLWRRSLGCSSTSACVRSILAFWLSNAFWANLQCPCVCRWCGRLQMTNWNTMWKPEIFQLWWSWNLTELVGRGAVGEACIGLPCWCWSMAHNRTILIKTVYQIKYRHKCQRSSIEPHKMILAYLVSRDSMVDWIADGFIVRRLSLQQYFI